MQRPRSIAHSRISQRSNRNNNNSSNMSSSSNNDDNNNNNNSHNPMSIPPPTSESNWTVEDAALRDIPSFYPLEKSSRYVQDTASRIAHRISDCCRVMSVQAHFNNDLVSYL